MEFNEKEFLKSFEEITKLDLGDKITVKNNGFKDLKYLGWTYAVEEFTKKYPDFTYEVCMFGDKPYMYDENTGYMVMTKITAQGITKCMWLPVMDGANRAMKSVSYEVVNKKGVKSTVLPATMFDVNKTIMRCLVKNMAMFGLGLYIFAGDDIPDGQSENSSATKSASEKAAQNNGKASKKQIDYIQNLMTEKGMTKPEQQTEFLKKNVNVERYDDLTVAMASKLIEKLK